MEVKERKRGARALVKSVFVVATEGHRWWTDRLRDAGFTFANQMKDATLIVVPGTGESALRMVHKSLRPKAIVLQNAAGLTAPQALEIKDLGFLDIYFGRPNRDEFVAYIATKLNHM